MRAFRFLHASDLHLDSPFRGHVDAAPELAPVLREATFRTFARLVDIAITEKVDFVLLAGDLYDGKDRSLRAQLALREGLVRLDEAKIKSFVVHGNHDPLSGRYAQLSLPPSVHVFDGTLASVPIKKDWEVIATITGVSYARADVTENLAKTFPRPEGDGFPIGLLHANLGGDTGHANYAPCTLGDLASSGYRYWALGHVHTQAVHRSGETVAAYPGNPQGRSVRELGPRGCLLVEVSQSGKVETQPVIADEVRWHRPAVSIEGLTTLDELIERIDEEIRARMNPGTGHNPSGHVFRVDLTGRGALHADLARGGDLFDLLRVVRGRWHARSSPARFALIESLVDATGREVDRAALQGRQTILGEALKLAGDAKNPGAAREELKTVLENLFKKAGMRDAVDGPTEVDLDRILERAVEMAIDALESGVEPERPLPVAEAEK